MKYMNHKLKSKYILLVLLFGVGVAFSPAYNSGFGLTLHITQAPTIDGVISPGEYSSSTSLGIGDYLLHWEVIDGTTIYFGIIGKTTGWVAIGFDPDSQMLNADIIFAWVESNGTVVFFDAFSRNQVGPDHPSDTDIGGTFDLLSYNATENATTTSIEFSRLLSTGDTGFDKPIPTTGSINIIWALGSTDSFSQYHGGSRGTAAITFVSSGETSTTTTTGATETSDDTQTTSTSTTTNASSGFELFVLWGGLISLIWISRRKK
ncbi:MAG: DOMON domain-containing protein [Candidatus Hodarchaeales archaeon]|jgi:hypothetical protein